MKPSMLRLFVLALVPLAVIAWIGGGCTPPKKPVVPREKITIAYALNITPALVYVAFAKGYFAEEGLDATQQPYAYGKPALEAVLGGKADLATAGDTPFMFAVMNGRKVSAVAVINTSNRNEAIIARRDRGIEKPADLNGKKIGVTVGTTADFFAYAFFLNQGIDRRKVKRVDLKPGEMVEALETGKVDAVSTWVPTLNRLKEKLGRNGVVFYGEALYTETFCLAGREEYVKKNPESIKKVLRALIKAETFMHRYPEDSRRLVAVFTKTEKAVLDEAWDIFSFRVAMDQAFLVDVEEQSRWAMKNRMVAGTEMPNYLDFIYVDPLYSVRPEAVRIIR